MFKFCIIFLVLYYMYTIFPKENSPNCINFIPYFTWVKLGSPHKILTKIKWNNQVMHPVCYLLLNNNPPPKFSGLEKQLCYLLTILLIGTLAQAHLSGSSVGLTLVVAHSGGGLAGTGWSKMASLKCLAIVRLPVRLPCFSSLGSFQWASSELSTWHSVSREREWKLQGLQFPQCPLGYILFVKASHKMRPDLRSGEIDSTSWQNAQQRICGHF